MEIDTSSAPVLLLQADRIAAAGDVIEAAQQATPAQTPAVIVELSAAATALAAGSGGSPEAA